MDRDGDHDVDLPDLELPLDEGDGGDFDEPPDDTGGGGGGRPGRPPRPDGFVTGPWMPVVSVAVILLFGLQTLAVVWVSRSGYGSEVAAWVLALLFVGTFTAVFIVGARFIARHRH